MTVRSKLESRRFILRQPAKAREVGFTLVELMIALLLGLVVIAGVISVFLSNQQVYRSNEALSNVQDSSRLAFEMLARDIRAAGLNGCGNSGRLSNVLNNGPNKSATPAWWATVNNPMVGYASTQTDPAAGTNRVAGTDSIILLGAEGTGNSLKVDAEPAANFTINESSTDIKANDVVVVCDPDHAAVVQITAVAGSVLSHAASGTPGNCTTDLSYPSVCSSSSSYVFAPNALISKLSVSSWYIGTNGIGGKSLFHQTVSLGTVQGANEMVRDVTGMQILYHQSGDTDFKAADSITNWPIVDAVQITLTTESVDKRAGVNAKPVSRSFTSTTTLRNRVS